MSQVRTGGTPANPVYTYFADDRPSALANGATIPAGAGQLTVHVSAAGAVTGLTMAAGARDGQILYVVNTSAFTLTFAASGSNVADGSSDAIPASVARGYIYDSATSLWYRIG